MAVEIETRFWPIVYVRVDGDVSESDVAKMSTAFDAIFARGGKFTSLTDVRGVGVPGARERKAIATWMQAIEPRMKLHCVGASTLMRSNLIRGALTAIYWVFTPPVPQNHPATASEAVKWCEQRLAAAGVDAKSVVSGLAAYVEANARASVVDAG